MQIRILVLCTAWFIFMLVIYLSVISHFEPTNFFQIDFDWIKYSNLISDDFQPNITNIVFWPTLVLRSYFRNHSIIRDDFLQFVFSILNILCQNLEAFHCFFIELSRFKHKKYSFSFFLGNPILDHVIQIFNLFLFLYIFF